MPEIEPLLTAQEAGELLGVSANWVLVEARNNRIPHIRLGRYKRFDRQHLLAWRESRMQGPVRTPIDRAA